MGEQKHVMTYEGARALEEEKTKLRARLNGEIAEKLKEARAFGDLSENAEYDAAKAEQADVVARIEEIENLLKNAEVIDVDEVDVKTVGIGCRVRVQDMTEKEELEYSIVGSSEADSIRRKISNESPIGRALMGSKKNDVVEVETQAGVFRYKVMKIERSRAS